MSKNLATTTIASHPGPPTSATSVTVATGTGSRLYTGMAVIHPANTTPTPANAEVISITDVTGDVLTIVRAQESSTARAIATGDVITQGITAAMWDTLVASNAGKADAAATTSALAGKASTTHTHSAADVTSGTLPLALGGTGGTDAATARTNLGLGTAAVESPATLAGNVAFTAAFGPLPTGTPTVGQVPVVTTASPLALGWGSAGGGTASFVQDATMTTLGKWARARARVLAGTGDARILCIGDSTTEGTGAGADATFPEQAAWPARMTQRFVAEGLPSACGFVPGKNIHIATTNDTRWTVGTGWTNSNNYGVLGASYTATAPAGSLVWTDGITVADTYDIYFIRNSGLGTITITATGGTAVVQACTGVAGIGKVTASASAASAANTVTITATGGLVGIVGIEPRRAALKQVLVANWGFAGESAAFWAGDTGTFDTSGVVAAYQPDLTLIKLGLNDADSVTASQYIAFLNTIKGWASSYGDVAFLTWAPTDDAARLANQAEFIPALRTSFAGTNAVFDKYARAVSNAAWRAAGLTVDGLHPNDLGHIDEGIFMARSLLAF